MQADRQSAYYATYSAKSLEDALQYEFDKGVPVLGMVIQPLILSPQSKYIDLFWCLKESIHGARKFVDGVGHHGKFQLNGSSETKK